MEPNTWGVWGGKIDDPDASVKQEAIREFNEESGYDGPIKLINAYVYEDEDGDFKYYNFLGLIPDEFEPKISWEHQWETQGWEWMSLEELTALHPKHFGLEELISNSMSLIQDYANEE
jgi:8-oxo-dGTP pyrophosphatase MutT (NUDIX family)